MYNLTNASSGNPVQFVQGVNQLAGGYFGLVIILGIFSIFFFGLKYYDSKKALATSLFITSVLGMLLRWVGVINDQVFLICVLAMIISAVGLLFNPGE